MAASASNFQYQQLVGSAIRLLEFSVASCDESLALSLTHVSLDEKPEFVALSYVWGDSADTRAISVNGSQFPVTVNLFEALSQTREFVRTGEIDTEFTTGSPRLFWADAICIDQSNHAEKAAQVPRMGAIYGSAMSVFGWLGRAERHGLSKAVVKRIFRKAVEISNDEQCMSWEAIGEYPLAEQLGPDLTVFAETFVKMLGNSWFSRIWIVQEVVLARKPPYIILGSENATITMLLFLWKALTGAASRKLEPHIAFNLISEYVIMKLLVLRDKYEESQQLPGAENQDLAEFGQRLNSVMRETSIRYKSTLQHDMIYGVLSMAKAPNLPPHLAPNYTKTFAEVCRDYATFIIGTTGDLTILSRFESSFEDAIRDGKVPTWVPDFRQSRGTTKNPPCTGVVTFDTTGTIMTVDGVQLGTCLTVLQPWGSDEAPGLSERLQRIESDILRPSAHRRQILIEDCLAEWLLADNSVADLCNGDKETVIALYRHFCGSQSCLVDWTQHPHAKAIPTRDVVQVSTRWDKNLEGSAIFVAEDGSVGELLRSGTRLEMSDVVCVLKGSWFGSCFRPRGASFEFLGACRFRGGMKNGAFEEEFFRTRETQQFRIV